jgi:hypothetical protein
MAALAATTVVAAQSTFRTAVDSISVDVSVKSGNLPLLGLTAADFVLTDNGVSQTIESVSLDAVPFDVTLFLDTSPSIFGEQTTLKSDIEKIAAHLRPGDRLRLLVFDDQVRDVFGWTSRSTTCTSTTGMVLSRCNRRQGGSTTFRVHLRSWTAS